MHLTQSRKGAKRGGSLLLLAISVASLLGSQLALAADQFLLLNYAPDGFATHASSSTIMHYVAQKFGVANQASSLKVGVACLYSPGAPVWGGFEKELALMKKDLAMAQNLGIPILVQVDTETYLPPSLLNWYNSSLAGYDPAKTADVEWYGWEESTAIKLCWRNWGSPLRSGPAPNFSSPRFQAYEKSIYDLFLPVVLQWYHNLPADKKWLFVGWKCGWESTFNFNYRFFPNGNSYYGTSNNPKWNDQYQSLGYNAAKTSGIRTSGTLTASDHAKLIGKHLTFLAKLAFDAGIPREKISVHGTFYSAAQQDVDALVNPYSNPGASFYPCSSLCSATNTALFAQAVRTAKADCGAMGYGYGEFNLFSTDYHRWYSWFQSALHGAPDCIYQALYNYDSMYGHPSVEQAMLDAMALYPATPPVTEPQ